MLQALIIGASTQYIKRFISLKLITILNTVRKPQFLMTMINKMIMIAKETKTRAVIVTLIIKKIVKMTFMLIYYLKMMMKAADKLKKMGPWNSVKIELKFKQYQIKTKG